jgi:hypothetical protein
MPKRTKSNPRGAGRKPRPVPLVPLNMRVEPETRAAWDARKAATGLSNPKLLENLLAIPAKKVTQLVTQQIPNSKRSKIPNV